MAYGLRIKDETGQDILVADDFSLQYLGSVFMGWDAAVFTIVEAVATSSDPTDYKQADCNLTTPPNDPQRSLNFKVFNDTDTALLAIGNNNYWRTDSISEQSTEVDFDFRYLGTDNSLERDICDEDGNILAKASGTLYGFKLNGNVSSSQSSNGNISCTSTLPIDEALRDYSNLVYIAEEIFPAGKVLGTWSDYEIATGKAVASIEISPYTNTNQIRLGTVAQPKKVGQDPFELVHTNPSPALDSYNYVGFKVNVFGR